MLMIVVFDLLGNPDLSLVDDENGNTSRFQSGGSSSYWYQRFAQGCRSRMGEDVRQDLAVTVELWVRMLQDGDLLLPTG